MRGADDASPAKPFPNIVFILTDDTGYGDLGCYGSKGIKTPNVDRLAAQGIRFTNAYAPSATCTPTRYACMTGEYAWRKHGTGILPGNAALIIEPGRTTLPSVLKKAGYATAAIGKWHLGLGDGEKVVDFNAEIKPGPCEIGFDYFFGMPATTDRVPCVYVENHRVVNLDPADPISVSYVKKVGLWPTAGENPELCTHQRSNSGHKDTIVNGIGRIGWMTGGKLALWQDELMAQTYVSKATAFIESHKSQPFFLYYATHEPHVPRWPDDRFRGKNPAGIRVEALEEMDWCIGEVLNKLDQLGLADNTLVIVTSDNGPAVSDGYDDGALEHEKQAGHKAAGHLRGGKYTPYEGGVREPLIVRWPAQIKQGNQVSNEIVSLVDLLATAAALTGQTLQPQDGVDSLNVLPALTGTGPSPRHDTLFQGNYQTPFPYAQAIRDGAWKLVCTPVTYRKLLGHETKNDAGKPFAELYNLTDDAIESTDLAAKHPDKLQALFDKLVAQGNNGFTRPGAAKIERAEQPRKAASVDHGKLDETDL